jgi:hypothetical protein
VGRGRGQRRLRAGDAPQHQGGLAYEDLKHFAFEAAIAKRHLPQVVVIDDGLRRLGTGRRR